MNRLKRMIDDYIYGFKVGLRVGYNRGENLK